MRSYAAARQFMYLFTKLILTSITATSDLKNIARDLHIVQAFPKYPDPQNSGQPFQNYPLIETEAIANFEDKPKKIFFVKEYIPGQWETFLAPETFDTNLNNYSPAINHLMAAFQHWTYNHTHGQLTVTNLKGVVPLMSKPKIVDLNPV
ncbi:hypothetical protein PtA15_2A745 [Puccinia triticina]|uniref:Alpha-type protein kinase domain-containing protein n=1 Tax=Puccinia triticina TaxID=208348 RepID=A0ABY7CBZ5_9BASI|nr:uncharacterized protein PtA15_2A745 [Puccinia triticina]WAQ82428.1 hypothetical protein PtA15_2A745 [Puccinia triticina]